MKFAVLGVFVFAAALAAFTIVIVFHEGAGSPAGGARREAARVTPSPAPPAPTPLPATWLEPLDGAAAEALLIACLDATGDERINAADRDWRIPPGVEIALQRRDACVDAGTSADFYPGRSLPPPESCGAAPAPLLIALIASAGSDLMQPSQGESLGLLDVAHGVDQRLAGVHVSVMASTAAIFGAVTPQTSMERWLTAHLRQRLDAHPCLRVALIGHSHGGVAATTIAAALERDYGGRLFVVLIDRSAALYDRVPAEMPWIVPVLNVFQLNEGWHGVPIEQPNVENVDASDERGPIALSDGGGPGDALVSHKTLDDAPAVQRLVIDRLTAWAVP